MCEAPSPSSPQAGSTTATQSARAPSSSAAGMICGRWLHYGPRQAAVATAGRRARRRLASAAGGEYATLTNEDVSFFGDLLGEGSGMLVDSDSIAAHSTCWLEKYRGRGSIVLRPNSTEQVSAILKHCNQRRLAVVPQGGKTGLVGGSVPLHDEIVVSLSRMNQISSFDPQTGVLTCEAGCILQTVDDWLRAQETPHIMPLDLGAKGTCQVGGNLATNAGGLRFLRYGSLRGSVLGVEAVTADGSVVDCMSGLRKDNTGFDIKQLFIGSEGSLGIITRASILCPVKSRATNLAFLACNDYAAVQRAYITARNHLSEIISAFEFMDGRSVRATIDTFGPTLGLRDPLPPPQGGDGGGHAGNHYPFYVVIETSGAEASHDVEKLSICLEQLMGEGVVIDGVVSQDDSQSSNIWAVREMPPMAYMQMGALHTYDLSIRVSDLYDVVEATRARLAEHIDSGQLHVDGFGHFGDGNLHLNVVRLKDATMTDAEVQAAMEPWIYEYISERGGSISAEHGLGQMKNNHIHYSKDAHAVELMRRIKTSLDPHRIMNPYKVLPTVE